MRTFGGMLTSSPISREQFGQAMERLAEALGVKTQTELAKKVGVRQSSVADAKKRGSIPDSWLLKIVCAYHINPLWVMHGTGPKFLVPSQRRPKPGDPATIIAEMPIPALLQALACRMGYPDIRITH